MPTYEYECTKCARVFELFHSITLPAKRTIKTDCKKCNNRAPVTRRIGAGAGIIFKGSGFYQTDYRSDAYKKAAEADKKSTESKSTKDGDAKSGDKKTESTKTETKPKKPDAKS